MRWFGFSICGFFEVMYIGVRKGLWGGGIGWYVIYIIRVVC